MTEAGTGKDRVDEAIRTALAHERKLAAASRLGMEWPSEDDFCDYLSGGASENARERMERFLCASPEGQRFVLRAREILRQKPEGVRVPDRVLRRAKELAGFSLPMACPHCGKSITPFKSPPTQAAARSAVWLLAACAAFALSFAVPRYFMQCLGASFFCALKWAIDRRAMKTRILIYKALEEEARNKALRDILPKQ